jgi:hypothetical protein
MTEIDYKLLLLKYISHVGYCEGISFLGGNHGPEPDLFTKEEWEEL